MSRHHITDNVRASSLLQRKEPSRRSQQALLLDIDGALLMAALILISAAAMQIPAAGAARLPDWSIMPVSLDYYVQVGFTLPSLGTLIPAIDSSSGSTFGQTQLFAFNVTQGADPTSFLLGSMRGYTVQASSSTDFHGVEVEVLTYDDGSLNGTISLQGLINAGTNEIAIIGGSGDFRGARGYAIITFLNSTATLALYKHQLFFL
ncbi:hypothetical protein L7F22_027865 [Adiantum nelumboides]|nr:hypothetical protein [Adiantum nelumboides]